MKIYLHKNFIMGNYNVENITDYKFFNDVEKPKFLLLLSNLLKNKGNFCGANKTSDNHINQKIRNLSKKFNIRHYHFADNCVKESCKNMNVCKFFLPLKDYVTKAEVLHYLYDSKQDLVVFFGYSRIHDNLKFPSLNTRPMVERLSYSSNVSFNVFELLNYIELSETLNLEISFSNFKYLNELLTISSITWLQLNIGTIEFETIKIFYDFIIDSCNQLNIEKDTLTIQELTEIYHKISELFKS